MTISIGKNATATSNSVVIGKNAITTSSNNIVIGAASMRVGVKDWEKIPYGISIKPITLLTHQHIYYRDLGKLLLANPIKDLVVVSAKKGPDRAGIYFVLGKLSWKIDQLIRLNVPKILLVESHPKKGSKEYRLTTVEEIYQIINSKYTNRRKIKFPKLKAVYVNIGELDESKTN